MVHDLFQDHIRRKGVTGPRGRHIRVLPGCPGLGLGMHVVISREIGQQVIGQTEIGHPGPGRGLRRQGGDARILPIQDHGAGGGFGHLGQETCSGIDFTEPVQLVAHDVEEEGMTGLDLPDEVDRVGLVQFQNGYVRIQLPTRAEGGDQG